MAFERLWNAVPPEPLTAPGNSRGVVTLASTFGLRVGQKVALHDTANVLPTLSLDIGQVLSPTQAVLVLPGTRYGFPGPDLSAYSTTCVVYAQQQPKTGPSIQEIEKAVYEQEPVVAIRTIGVDPFGNFYSASNPLPVAFDGTISIGSVSIVEGGNTLVVNPDGTINVAVVSSPSATTQVVSTYNEVLAVPSGATTTLVTYTVPAGKQAVLQRAAFSGENVARYDMLVNGAAIDTARTMFGGDLTGSFEFVTGNDSGLVYPAGTVFKVQVLHNRPLAGAFEARIQALLF